MKEIGSEIIAMAPLLTAIGTFLVVVVALFREEITQLWRRPRLIVQARLAPPDCHKTRLDYRDSTGRVLHGPDCYYLRLWVENVGRQRAEQVQVYLAKLYRQRADKTFAEERAFLPMNLRWSHTGEVFAQGISRDMGRHCDLGHVLDPSKRPPEESLKTVNPADTLLSLDLEVKPNTQSHLLSPGVYRLDLKVAATNARPRTKKIELTVTGHWFADEAGMFKDGIGLVELN